MGEPKSIVLFSDGTGNSSATLFKTNVWRTYEAVDLGPATPGKQPQIAYYDDGIGTSSFRPLAMLAGMLGIGLKRNILDIYRYACRNYAEGDDIYGFGFSRGAFTMRLVVAMIASQGLVQSTTEAELMARSSDAYRRFRREFEPRILKQPTRLLRDLRDAIIRRRRPPGEPPARHPNLRFVGVWDTVAAYGGPIVEIVRAIDNWFYALSMPDYRLSPRVACARHALALDDARDAFQPLVWDEVHEATLVREGTVADGRLQQLWFTGMHADVGGGYPDESLSYVSLLWMLEEAEKAGLRTLTVMTDRFRALANSSGPIHDSRAGLGSYYRYQPRRLAGLVDPPIAECRVQWDPALATEPGKRRGLLKGIAIHESVAARIASGTDRYAPITLPGSFAILPPQRDGETAPQADNQSVGEGAAAARPALPPRPMISAAARAAMLDPAAAGARDAAMARVWDLVWWRRFVYFVSLTLTLVLVALPLRPDATAIEGLCADDRCLLPGLFGAIGAFLPGIAEPWLVAFGRHPFLVLALLVALLISYRVSGRIEAATRATAYAAWHARSGPGGAHRLLAIARAIRRWPTYQGFFLRVKWYAMPFLVAGLMLLAGVWLAGAFVTQSWLVVAERDGSLCPRNGAPAGAELLFRTATPCTDLHRRVRAGDRIEITLRPRTPWADAGYRAAPDVGVIDGLPLYAAPLGIYRRVVTADWMKPLIAVRNGNGFLAPGATLRVEKLDLAPQPDGSYVATWQATTGGDLYLMVNDAVLPWQPRAFYDNNTGSAAVDVRPLACARCRRPAP